MGLLDGPADALGCTSAALRLLLGILSGYPLALLYRSKIRNFPVVAQHAFFASTGMTLVVLNYGWDIMHSLTNIFVVYVIMLVAGRTTIGLALNFSFTLGYLLIGYLWTATENYDIKWTMPHCILCLRLIGVAFDYFDGGKDFNKLPPDQQQTALNTMPSLLEMLGHSYFFGGCMVGPQFPMSRYRSFVARTLFPNSETNADSVPYSISRLTLGLGMMAFYQVAAIFVNDKTVLSDDFLTSWSFTSRWLYLGLYGTVVLHKYVACWLMAEGSCALSGLSYNGKDAFGNNLWDGLCNIWVWRFESTTNFDGFIRAFNINTNKWVAQYIFKRLRFLGSKELSQLLALGFLALWHGFHLGYYVCFFNEFIVMKLERDFIQIIDSIPTLRAVIYHEKLHYLRLIIMKVYVACLFGYCLVPFCLLSYSKFSKVYASFYWLPNILLVSWFAASFYIMPLFKKSRRDATTNGGAREVNGKVDNKKD